MMKKSSLKGGQQVLIYSLIGMVVFTHFAYAEGIVTDGSIGVAQNLTGPKLQIPQSLGTTAGNNLFHSFESFNIQAGESAFFKGIATDGSVGVAQSLTGPKFQIPQSLGTTAGNNLFHSFKSFTIQTGESAVFSGSDSLKNVISRVTGGNPSTINGLLQSTIAHANFYFINPSGVTFGANAKIDVPAAFHVSTADSLRFSNGDQLRTALSEPSVFSTADPVSFGFLGNHAATIEIQESRLRFKKGSTVSLSASDITINQGKLLNETGDIQLYATGSPSIDINIDPAKPLVPYVLSGKLTIKGKDTDHKSVIDASGNGAGRVVIRSGIVDINNSDLFADNSGSIEANLKKGIDIIANNMTVDNSFVTAEALKNGDAANLNIGLTGQLKIIGDKGNAIIRSAAWKAGNAGDVNINANDVLIDGKNATGIVGITSDSEDGSTGNAGTIKITSNTLSLQNGGIIRSSSFSQGNAGHISIDAKDIVIDGAGVDGLGSKISSDVGRETNANSGNVIINSDNLTLSNGGIIRSGNWGKNEGGSVTINVNKMLIDAKDNKNFTGVNTAVEAGGLGNGGKITVIADELTIQHGGQISSSTLGQGNAGTVSVTANTMTIDRQGSDSLTGISSAALSQQTKTGSNAGTVAVTVNDKLSLLGGGMITTSTLSTLGNAGNVEVNAGNLLIDGSGGGTQSIPVLIAKKDGSFKKQTVQLPNPIAPGISSDNFFSSGHAGTVAVNANELTMSHGGEISSATLSSGNAGSILISAPVITMDNASISAKTTAQGHAGSVTIQAEQTLTETNHSSINSSTSGSGSAGSVNITAPVISIDNSTISAEATANSSGKTGDVNVTASKTLRLAKRGSISIQNDATVADPSHIKAGVITLSAPDIDLQDSTITAAATGNVDAGSIVANFSHQLSMDTSLITTAATDGNGGIITINGGELINSYNSGFLTSVTGADGNGGNINVAAGILVMNTGVIQANALAGRGGDINLNLKALIPSYDLLTKSGTQVVWQPYIPGFNVIQAASATGISGNINITSPQFDISGSISGLDAHPLTLPRIEDNPCYNLSNLNSSLVRSSKGGMPTNEAQKGFIPPVINEIDHTTDSSPDKQNNHDLPCPTPR
jgi:filamentous hemagglutinin family protein